jgi:hypothetical protein
MSNAKKLCREAAFMSFPLEKAIFCENCRKVSNSTFRRCGACGSTRILRLKPLIDGPPSGPEPGPAASGCLVPEFLIEFPRAA